MSDKYDELGSIGEWNDSDYEYGEDTQNDVTGGLTDINVEESEEIGGVYSSTEDSADIVLEGMEDGLTGLDNGKSEDGGLAGDASQRERDAANMRNQEPFHSFDFDSQPQSLKDYATMGMGEGLSAAKESLGVEGKQMELHAALQDEEPDEAIHAELEDEEEESIHAGRSDPAPINAGYGKPQQAVGGGQPDEDPVEYNVDIYGIEDNKMAKDEKQNIDDIFIAGNFGRSSSFHENSSETGGTMYHGEDEKSRKEYLHLDFLFGMPSFVRNILIMAVILVVVYAILVYGFHVPLQTYFHPVQVQEYCVSAPEELESKLRIKFKNGTETYSSSTYEYTYNIKDCGGLKLVDYNGNRMYIEITDLRINYSIYGVRPQMTKFDEATEILNQAGFVEISQYEETEELGAQGQEHVFFNQKTGEGIIVGKKQNYDTVKAVKYTVDYKKYDKLRKSLRGE